MELKFRPKWHQLFCRLDVVHGRKLLKRQLANLGDLPKKWSLKWFVRVWEIARQTDSNNSKTDGETSLYITVVNSSSWQFYLYLHENVRITLAGKASGVAYNDAAGLLQHGYIAQWLLASVQPQPSR